MICRICHEPCNGRRHETVPLGTVRGIRPHLAMPLDTELWRAVPGFEGYYEASTLGRVRSLDRIIDAPGGAIPRWRKRGRVLKPVLSNKGYLMVSMKGEGKRLTATVHKIVLLTFRGPRPPGAIIRHLNGNAFDSRLENITYGTPRENNLDKVLHGTDHNVNRTHCRNDHPLFGANLYVTPDGHRACKTCRRAAKQRYRSRIAESNSMTPVWSPADGLAAIYEITRHMGLVGELP